MLTFLLLLLVKGTSVEDTHQFLIVLGFNNITLVGHFVSSPREREKRDRRESSEGHWEERGTGMKVKKQKK